MTDEERYEKALAYATKKHNGQFRKGGEPYIVHPIAVSQYVKEWGYGIDYQITGLFHDLLEDTEATEEEILALSNEKVLTAVKLLTKVDDYVMADYVAGLKSNEISKVVKAADRLHNLRSAYVCSEDFKRRYVLETLDWYMDLCPEIKIALKDLVDTMDTSFINLPLEYDNVDDWIENI